MELWIYRSPVIFVPSVVVVAELVAGLVIMAEVLTGMVGVADLVVVAEVLADMVGVAELVAGLVVVADAISVVISPLNNIKSVKVIFHLLSSYFGSLLAFYKYRRFSYYYIATCIIHSPPQL